MTTPIKIPRFHRHAVADTPAIFGAMTPQEILANFGGRQRLQRMGEVLKALADAGCELFIVSIGFRDSCILPHLNAVGLSRHFPAENVFGQDSRALQDRGFSKGRLIADIMADPKRQWSAADALFIDDSIKHVESAAEVCEVIRVLGRGLSFLELDAVEAVARGQRVPSEGQAPWQLRSDEAVAMLKHKTMVPGSWYVIQPDANSAKMMCSASLF
eukprot:CAMPEP_0181472380 /NCGR_PEP_ID=MMETSP1110-20121109/39572_1 /TAXON_ID=174948 /ORGANISM="Symbiodinium sp., Strain CCMP421" /LENGTH=214 /DNA_ID=CAMNT_0023597451 /DNA_START=45 /DNA_END=689 /DNA_ORIENTATION=-